MTKKAIYTRVSSQEQLEGWSLDAQKRIIEQYITLREWKDVAYFSDEGLSAFNDEVAKRPGFAAMLAAAKRGEFDTIIVHKLDRFARSLVLTLTELAELERAGVAFVSVAEQFDFTTSIGRVVLATLAAFAEFYSRNLSTEVKKGLAERKAAGLAHGRIPWGASRVNGRNVVNPERADTLALILALARDHSSRGIARELNTRGIPGPSKDGHWTYSIISRMIECGGWLLHEPPPWPQLYAAALPVAPQPSVRVDRQTWPLSGLLRCPCGGRLNYSSTYARKDGTKRRWLLCWRYDAERPDATDYPYGRRAADVYEDRIFAYVERLQLREAAEREETDIAAALAGLQERRELALLRVEARTSTAAEFRRALAQIDAEEARLVREEAAGQTFDADALATFHAIRTAPPAQQNQLLRWLFRSLTIAGETITVDWQPDAAAGLVAVGAP
ncbi:MAG: recombinase family protein [Thermomicrobiales bacterium]